MNTFKKAGRLIISMIVVVGIMISHLTIRAYATAQSDKTTIDGLCTGSIINPKNGDTKPYGGQRCYVYYGVYEDHLGPIMYRVLSKCTSDFGGRTMLLDCDYPLRNDLAHNPSGDEIYGENGWSKSWINGWLNGGDFYGNENIFSAQERAAIAPSVKLTPALSDGEGKEVYMYQPLIGEHIFLLDAKEVTNSSYGFASDPERFTGRTKDCAEWALRSPHRDVKLYAIVGKFCDPDTSDPVIFCTEAGWGVGVCPAFNLDLSSIIFTSLISGTAGEIFAEYKLTVKDSNLGVTPGTIEKSENIVTVPYVITGANKDKATQLSILITEGNPYEAGKAATSGFDYMKLSVDTWGTTGTGTFTLPQKYEEKEWGSDYYVYILAETVKGTYETDYASEPIELTIGGKTVTQTTSTDQGTETASSSTVTTPSSIISLPSETTASKVNKLEEKDSDEDESEVNKPETNEPEILPPDYLDVLYKRIEEAIEEGGEKTVYWDQGTALPYDLMKILEEHPDVTLIFSYYYQDTAYKVTICGKNFKADPKIEWYGPSCLYGLFGNTGSVTSNSSGNPNGNKTYTVVPGDSLSKIAGRFKTTVGELARINDITNPNIIHVGQVIKH